MLIKEYRISLPMSVEEYRIAQLYMIQVHLMEIHKTLHIVCAGTILKGSTCLLWDITTEKLGLCQYALCITQNTYIKK